MSVIELQRGDAASACEHLRRALSLREDVRYLQALALALQNLQRYDEAEAAWRRIIALQPEHPAAYCDLGLVLLRKPGARAEAGAAFRRALELNPDFPEALCNLGGMLCDDGRTNEAEKMLRHAIELRPDMGAGYCNLGLLLLRTGRNTESIATLRRALEFDPNSAETLVNLGGVLREDWQLGEAEKVLRRVIALRPDMSNAHANLGNVFKSSSRLDEAIACYRRAVELDPSNFLAHSNLVFTMMFAHDDSEGIYRECAQFSAQHETPLLAQPVPPYANDRSRTRRLRIGYVSPDFRYHCQVFFMMPLLSHHDHQNFEIFCYASVLKPDEMTTHLTSFADVWRDVHEFDDARLAQQIRDDQIDVLVDLTMHMANGRPLLFARRPAPVQVAWLAYPGTTGSRAIGYRLTDPWLDPPGVPHADERYSERSIRLPDAFWCYSPLTHHLAVNALPALTNGYVTFGCLNNPCKVTDMTMQLWARVLRALPTARFILMAAPGEPREALQQRFAAQGIDPARVSFMPFQSHEEYLRTYLQMDMALDTVPYNGHTTSLDSFWMGVPVITRMGWSAVSRGGLSLAANLQMLDLAADNDDDYVRIAVQLAGDLPRLAAMRAELRTRMERSPLMDSARFARSIEQAYRRMWDDWCIRQEQQEMPH
jgi:predicted O-linked N-acetylglucosamine transferase (SPINDLY family)